MKRAPIFLVTAIVLLLILVGFARRNLVLFPENLLPEDHRELISLKNKIKPFFGQFWVSYLHFRQFNGRNFNLVCSIPQHTTIYEARWYRSIYESLPRNVTIDLEERTKSNQDGLVFISSNEIILLTFPSNNATILNNNECFSAADLYFLIIPNFNLLSTKIYNVVLLNDN